jgi:hypothetical protein
MIVIIHRNNKYIKNIVESFKYFNYDCECYSLKNGRLFPDFFISNNEIECVCYVGFNENAIAKWDCNVFSILPETICDSSYINYRFIEKDKLYIIQNVSDLPLNSIYSMLDIKSLIYNITILLRDKRLLTNVFH